MTQPLVPAAANSIWKLVSGTPREHVIIPNGDTPEWQVALVSQVWHAENGARMGTFLHAIRGHEFEGAINAQVLAAGSVQQKSDKPEKEFKSRDYVELLQRLGYQFRLCDLDDRVEVNNEPISDVIEAEMRAKSRDAGINRVNVMRDAYITEAAAHRYHPVREYLNNVRWDGRDYIATLGAMFVDDQYIFPTLIKRWLVGAVGKAYTGSQNRMLVLDGTQGIGKSYFVKWLASPLSKHFTEGPINPDDKDDLIRLMNNFIWEVSELGSTMRRADVEALKHFLTRQQVNVRTPYAHNDVIKPALASFIGTVNNIGGILNDASGNRRFMVVNITSIDREYSQLPVDQIWAQAVSLYRAGEPSEPTTTELTQINEANSEYEIDDPLEDLILKHFDVNPAQMTWFTPTLRISEILHDHGWRGSTPRAEAMMIAPATKKLGLKRIYTTWNGVTQRGYCGMREKTLNQPSNPPTY